MNGSFTYTYLQPRVRKTLWNSPPKIDRESHANSERIRTRVEQGSISGIPLSNSTSLNEPGP